MEWAGGSYLNTIFKSNAPALATSAIASWVLDANSHGRQTPAPSTLLPVKYDEVKSRVVCKSERKLLDASVRLPWRPPSVREA